MNMVTKLSTLIEVHKEGDVYIASDLISGVSDLGETENEAVKMLLKGLKERYETIVEESTKIRRSTFSRAEVLVNA